MATLDIHQIKNYLPHRYPFLLLDRILSVEPQESLVALKNVTINEPYFEGHFPHRPVMPGVLILEAMAQASAILASYGLGDKIVSIILPVLIKLVLNVRLSRVISLLLKLRSKGAFKICGSALVLQRLKVILLVELSLCLLTKTCRYSFSYDSRNGDRPRPH
jgi:3-hydroxymyristoyl/3-hydroxydecanoyl-(acyl carrier protein) dehydratase